MAVNQTVNLRDYVRLLESRPGEVTTLFRELLIGVTSFFRDREVFDDLATNHLPALLGNQAQHEFRFWVSGCSTGEEAYTMAILAKETMEKIKRHVNIKIFATDIDRDAILFAGNGLYPESIAADIPAALLRKYFIPKDEHYQIHRSIREMVVFARHNLIKDPPFTNIDLLSCRNLLIYLQPILQRKVIEFFNFSLNPQGIMLLGTSETPGESGEFFEPIHHKHKLYRSRGKKNRSVERPQFKANIHDHEQLLLRPYTRPNYRTSAHAEERLLTRILDLLSEDFIPVMAVVNEHMELVHLTGDDQHYFRLPSGKQSNDITRMAVKELSIPLATGLQKIFHNGTEIKYTNVRLPEKDGTQILQLRIRLLPGKKGQDPLAAVFIQGMPQPGEQKERGKVEEFNISQEAEQRIIDLEQDLQFTKENLQATIEELETSNEELQATNEELLASNEELQSTNEELQSVNEELHTVNAEYQSKILELTEITNDLENLIAATQIATLFLDENLEIRKFTPELTEIFRILQNDIGRPVSHLAHKLENVDLIPNIKEVVESGSPLEREVCTNNGEWFLMRILPYAIGGPTASGVVLTFTSIEQLKNVEHGLQKSEERYRLLFDEMLNGFALHEIICDEAGKPVDYRFLAVNSAFEDLTGLKKEQILGQTVKTVMPEIEDFWIERYGRVALEREIDQFDGFSAAIGKYYEARAYSPEKGKFAVMFHDITERKQIEEELLRSTQLLNATQELTRVGGWQWDVQTQKMYWTDEVYRIHGMDPGELEPGSPEHIERSLTCYEPKDRKKFEQAFQDCVNKGESYDLELPFTNLQGKMMRIRTTAQAILDGEEIVQVIGNIIDITPRGEKKDKQTKKP
jgi:two-component system CheB/CheR fusion protein